MQRGGYEFELVDCYIEAITEGIERLSNGQLVRVYFTFPDELDDEQVGAGPDRRPRPHLDLRAKWRVWLYGDKKPTIGFVDLDDESEEYVYTPWSNSEAITDTQYQSADEMALFRVASDEPGDLEPVGEYLTYAVPKHKRWTPHLDQVDTETA